MAMTAMLAVVLLPACSDPRGSGAAPPVGQFSNALTAGLGTVHGYLDAQAGQGDGLFGLPDATIRLRRADGLLTAAVVTDVKGFFVVTDAPVGDYVVCWTAAGFPAGCDGKHGFKVKDRKIVNPPHAVATPSRMAVWGRVALADGRDVHYENQLFGTTVDTFVTALTARGTKVAGPVRANSRGQYVLGGVPPDGSYRILATSLSSSTNAAVVVGTVPVRVDLLLPNRRPAAESVVALQGGKGVRHAAPGTVVQVQADASDPDGDSLHYRWLASPGASCGTADAPSVSCTLPAGLGTHSIFVQVSDGRQFAVARVQVATGPALALFSGTVVSGGAPVAGAAVKVNGVSVVTGATGGFSFTVAETDRYTLTIRKDGYQSISRVYQEARTGTVYPMIAVPRVTIDPTKDNVVVSSVPKGQERLSPVQITLHAGSIVDDLGNRVTTPVDVYASTIDHLFDHFDRMPGDYGALDAKGDEGTLTSFGAVEANLRGPGGVKYNLAPGLPADLAYTVHPSQLASAPASIPLWYYDDDKGIWTEDGKATLVGGKYLGQAKHFSVVNVDINKTDATCLKVVVDQTSLTVPFTIRVTVPVSGGVPIVRDRQVAENVSVIVRLPPTTAITIDVLDSASNVIPNSTRHVTTGPAVPAGTNLSLALPYNECVSPGAPAATLTVGLPQDPEPTYLSYLQNDAAYASSYYTAINADADLPTWKARNGFGPGADADAYYFNAGDLEFGRSMHMKHRADGGIAYYVTNFADADKALGGAASDVIATVAMEYSSYPSAVAGAPRFTKFYVFDKSDNRVDAAELDNRGARFVPGLCIICHGGTVPGDITAAGGDTQSRFIPFDTLSFHYPATLSGADQQESFRKLNEGVYLNTGATDAQKALIESWYPGGVSLPHEIQHEGLDGVPFDWRAAAGITAADQTFYYDVLRPSCRSCHNSRTLDSGLDWGTKAGFSARAPSIHFAACDSAFMPQSFVTWRNLWKSTTPSQPAALGSYLHGLNAALSSACTGP
jgi:hypothetical protein